MDIAFDGWCDMNLKWLIRESVTWPTKVAPYIHTYINKYINKKQKKKCLKDVRSCPHLFQWNGSRNRTDPSLEPYGLCTQSIHSLLLKEQNIQVHIYYIQL